MKEIAAIVVTYNRINLLKEVINSLHSQTYKEFDIIVVNNGSTDNTLEWLRDQNDIVTITQKNLGGAGGFHTGMKYATEQGYEYVWIMDDDVICRPDALEKLYEGYHRKDNIGFVCSKVLGVNVVPMNTPVVDNRTSENGYPDYMDMLEFKMIKVRIATFVSVFLSTEIISKVGLPYKEYFIWGDDSEYTKRVTEKYPSYLVGDSIVVHKRSLQKALTFENETDPQRIKMFFYMFRNSWYNEMKEKPWKERALFAYQKMRDGFHLCKTGNKEKGIVYIKAAAALVNFNPIIEYPIKLINRKDCFEKWD